MLVLYHHPLVYSCKQKEIEVTEFLEVILSESGLFAFLFVLTLVYFSKYIERHHKEIVKMNNGLGKRLNGLENYVQESLVDILIDTRAVLTHSTKINEIAIRELERRCPDCERDMTDSQIINKRELDGITSETQELKKIKKAGKK
jgi:hypothetical protein